MKLYDLRLACGLEGNYRCQMDIVRIPTTNNEAKRILLDAFGPELTPESIDDILVSRAGHGTAVSCSISGVPSAMLIFEV